MSDITITVDGDTAYMTAPRHRNAEDDYRDHGGRWNSYHEVWEFPADEVDAVREILIDRFGYDDQIAGSVTARIHVIDWERRHGPNPAMFCDRVIAYRPGRDEPVHFGRTVTMITDGFPGAGGSMKRPRICASDKAVVEVRWCPIGHPDLNHDRVEIISETAARLETLQAERDRLATRLAEVDGLISAVTAAAA